MDAAISTKHGYVGLGCVICNNVGEVVGDISDSREAVMFLEWDLLQAAQLIQNNLSFISSK